MGAYSKHSESELLLLLKESDELALREVIARYWDRMLSVALHRLTDLQEAEECVQDIFYNLWKKRETLVLRYSLNTYLSVAVKYQVLDLLDKQLRRVKLVSISNEEISELSAPSAEVYLLEKELWERLEQTVLALPEKCRVVYRLSKEQGKSNKEIATELDISEKTVEAHLTKAAKDIRKGIGAALPAFVIWLAECHLQDKL